MTHVLSSSTDFPRRMKALLAAACTLALSACGENHASGLFDPKNPTAIDKPQNLTKADYANILKPEPAIPALAGAAQAGTPELAPILASPQPPKLGQTKLVSIAVTDDVPLKDVLLELARLADVDIELDSSINGGIAFRAKDKPFNEVIERIADLAGLRYRMEKGVLRVERDTPYVEIYPIDFINIDRSTQSNVNISTNVLSSDGGGTSSASGSTASTAARSGGTGSGGGSGGLNTGSQSSITSKSDSDFWQKFEEGVRQITAYVPANMAVRGQAPGAATPGQPAAPAVVPVAPQDRSFYILNRQGATLTVSGTRRQQELIRKFLKQMEQSSSAQVLIEAKIVEVTLDREYQSGIDWNKIGGKTVQFSSKLGTTADPTDPTNITTFAVQKTGLAGIQGLDLDVAVKLAEQFGTARTLSSPRLHAINNQQAVLTFAQNQVYFQLDVQQSATTSVNGISTISPITVNSEIKTVPIGIILTMQPSINLESGEVTLNVRPTLSRITAYVSDPAVAYLVAQSASSGSTINIDNKVPVVEVRELDSILKLKSGQVMVIGGLMEDKASNTDKDIPFASDVPVLGSLFRNVARSDNTKELVIFIRATIMDSNGSAQNADKVLYKKFTTDPRPLNF